MGGRKGIDLTGQRFGLLTATRIVGRGNGVIWACRCDCGTVIYAESYRLRAGYVKSCGCVNGRQSPRVVKEFEPAVDCFAYDGDRCKCLREMLCRTKGTCSFYDSKEGRQ